MLTAQKMRVEMRKHFCGPFYRHINEKEPKYIKMVVTDLIHRSFTVILHDGLV
jgi:hypothetical protein